jgi:hypothetical protein
MDSELPNRRRENSSRGRRTRSESYGPGGARGNIERTLRTQYSVSSEMEQNFEEEITVTVPPKTALVLIMDWKTIVQEGYVRVQDSAGRTADVPFEVPLEVTFDQKQLGQGGVSGQAPRYATGTGTG